MASCVKAAKTLSKAEQKKSIKGLKKSKRMTVKNTLESPFALDWPVIDVKHEEEIMSLLEKSCSGLKGISCKPPWREVQKYKGAERKAFLEDFKQKFHETLDADAKRQNKEREDALSNLIIGYNAVMRALEKDCVCAVLVKKNVEPSFLVKTFLPGCANGCIPLVPLNDLDGTLKRQDTLALPHMCMVLGLKHSVSQDSNRFYSLYSKMCEAVNISTEDVTDEESEEQWECSAQVPAIEDKENSIHQYEQLTDEQVQSYHLKRIHKNKRVFVPGERKDNQVISKVTGADFIGLGSAVSDEIPKLRMERLFSKRQSRLAAKKVSKKERRVSQRQRRLAAKKVPKKEVKQKTSVKQEIPQEQEISQSDLETKDFSSVFFIDETGDHTVLLEEEAKVEEEVSKEETGARVQLVKGEGKRKLKEKRSVNKNPYVPAKTKRVKSNPNREEKKEIQYSHGK